jgi:hypothetical protein
VILLLFAIITLAASAFVLIGEENDAVSDPKQKAARGEIKGLDELSLVRSKNLTKVLADVNGSSRPYVSNIRVAPDRVNLTVRDADGERKVLTYDAAIERTTNDFGVGEDRAVRATSIDANAPERMLRTVTEKTEMDADALDYVTLTVSGESKSDWTWYMALKEGPARVRQWVAAADGSDVRKPGELSKAQKDENAARQRQFERQQRELMQRNERRTACISRATSAEAVSRCLERFSP